MSWQLTRMTTWTSAGGAPLGDLGLAKDGSQLRRELGGRGTATLVLDRRYLTDVPGRAIIRIDGTRDGYREVRITGRALQTQGIAASHFAVTGQPRIYDLADSGLVYEELGGRKIFTFNEALLPAQYLSRFLFVRQAQDGLLGIGPGLMGYTERVPLQWERKTRGELLDMLQRALEAEIDWRALEDGSEVLDIVRFVNDDAITVPLVYGDRLRDHQLKEDFSAIGTRIRIAGDAPVAGSERATIGENQWDVAGRRDLGDGTFAIELRAPGTLESPILEDGQYAAAPDIEEPACFLQREDGTTRLAILGSNATDSEVTVAGAAPLVGERVAIVADADGTPLETILLPSAARAYGVVPFDAQIPGGRGERQYARNGGHESGLDRWSGVNGGEGAEYLRSEFGITHLAQANGARAAATGTGTPFAIKGLTPGLNIRRGMKLDVGGADCAVDTDAIAETDGALVLDVAPGLPAPYPDDTLLTLERKETRSLELDGVQSPLDPVLNFKDVDTDGLRRIDPASSCALTSGDYEGTAIFDYEGVTLGSFTARRGGKVGAQLASLTWPTYDDDVFAVVPVSVVSGIGGTVMVLSIDPALISGGDVAIGTRLRFNAQPGGQQFRVAGGPFDGYYATWTVRVTAVGVDTITVTADKPVGASIVVLAEPASSGGTYAECTACNMLLADGLAWSLVITKEQRPVRLDGDHLAGATTVTIKPQTVIARRDFAHLDHIELLRDFSAYARLLSGAVTTDTDPYGATIYRLTATIDLAFSTVQHLNSLQLLQWTARLTGDLGGTPLVMYFSAESLTGATLTMISTSALSVYVGPFPMDTPPENLVLSETYGVDSATAWDTDGKCTLTLLAPVPAGRSYPRGQILWANWHTRASQSLNTSLRLADDVAAADTTIAILGGDNVTSATPSPATTGVATCYRVSSAGSHLPIAGNVLFAAASTVADGAGLASVVLTAANGVAIANNEAVTIRVPALVPPNLELAASALRLFSAVGLDGEPLAESAGQAHDMAYFRVPAGTTRTITAVSIFALSAGAWYAGIGPVLALVNHDGDILGFQRLGDDGLEVTTEPGVVILTAQATIAASGLYGFRVYGGGSADLTRWCVHFQTFFYLGEATDAPYTPSSWPTRTMLAGLAKLTAVAQPRITDQLTIQEWDYARLAAAGVHADAVPPIRLGGRVHLEEWDRVLRVTAHTETPKGPDAISQLEIGQLARDGSRLLAESALASTMTGVR